MIPVAELDRIAEARLEDAEALLAAGRFDGATYLCGYAIEVALKARICRTLNWLEFPRTGREFEAYRSFQTHELDVLLRLSGQEARIKQNHFGLWNIVAVWKTAVQCHRHRAAGRRRGYDPGGRAAIGGLMTVAEFTAKFAWLESEIARERGDFTLFALFMREDVPDRWDLIVSAPWFGEDRQAAVNYLVGQIKSRLGEEDLTCLSDRAYRPGGRRCSEPQSGHSRRARRRRGER